MKRSQTAAPFYRYEVDDVAIDGAPAVCTVIYCGTTTINVTRLADELNTLADDRLIPDRIFLLGREPSLDSMREAATNPRIVEMLPQLTRYQGTPVLELVTFDRNGALKSHAAGDTPAEPWDTNRSFQLLQAGLRKVMKDRGVVLSTNGYHFSKPSTRHSNRFIRTANALRYGSEVSFIAANLLGLLPKDGFDRVYTDTSSINAVAYSLKEHLRAFDEGTIDFTIDSFGSHLGADGAYNLSGSERALVLISATTSGGLVEKMQAKQHIDPSRMITLCYVGAEVLSNIVCDLTRRGDTKEARDLAELHDPFPNWEADECPDCERGYSLVVITGDQFLPASPSISVQDVKQTHAPEWLSRICKQLTGLGVVRCHVPTRSDSDPRSLYIDFMPLIELALQPDLPNDDVEAHRLAHQLRRRVLRDVPAGTAWIVHLDDPASERLAELANQHLAVVSSRVSDDRVVSARELVAAPESFAMDGLVLVVASAIVSGRSITSVSQALRTSHKDNPIAYVVLAARTPTPARTRTVLNNLGYGNGRFNEHRTSVLLEMALPDDWDEASSPWALESRFWKRQRDGVEDPDALAAKLAWLDDRVATLDQTAGDGRGPGLTDDLFLQNSPDAEPLQLQQNFAFWDFDYDSDRVAQSEVFFVVTAILHHMRTQLQLLKSGAHEHNWTVIDPTILARFNDPIIQAAFLRAATPHELDYTGQPDYSRDMAAILRPLVTNWESCDGGAAAEVLLALATAKIRLLRQDLESIQSLLNPNAVPEPLASLVVAVNGL